MKTLKHSIPLIIYLVSLLFNSANCQIEIYPNKFRAFTSSAELDYDIAGDMFLNSSVGAFHIGFPNNGNRWRVSTANAGADLLFRNKQSGASSFSTKFRFFQNGNFAIGNLTSSNAKLGVLSNSTVFNPHLKLTEQGSDFARLTFENTTASGRFWTAAALPSSTSSSARFNFYYYDGTSGRDFMTLTGAGLVGIYGTPTARLEIFQRGQQVGTGLRFDDGTANQDWNITHGFTLRFHYGGSLRGFINANTGAYEQSSDLKLKKDIESLDNVLSKVDKLKPSSYQYIGSKSQKKTIGLVAQEAFKVFPELVTYNEADALFGINYAGFSIVAIKAIQELSGELTEKESRIADLEERLTNLDRRIAMIENSK